MNKAKVIVTLAIILITGITFYSCKGPTDPPPPEKSARDYTWTADTLSYPESFQTLMSSMYATSTNNIYLVGHCNDSRGSIWHYDGKEWKPLTDDIFTVVARSSISPYQVHGTSENNIWIVGSRNSLNPTPPPNFLAESFIIQYDGTTWKEHKVNTKSAIY